MRLVKPTRLRRSWDSPGKNTVVGCHFLLQCMKVKSESEVAQSCLTLCNPMYCSLPGSSIHGIFQARVLEWGAIAFSEVYQNSPLIMEIVCQWEDLIKKWEVRKWLEVKPLGLGSNLGMFPKLSLPSFIICKVNTMLVLLVGLFCRMK